MKKLFNVKTGQFLELGKDWLDGGNCIYTEMKPHHNDKQINISEIENNQFIISCKFYKQNPTHPLNTMWNGIYNGCVYGDGEYVVVEISEDKTIDEIIQLENGIDKFTATSMDMKYRKIIFVID